MTAKKTPSAKAAVKPAAAAKPPVPPAVKPEEIIPAETLLEEAAPVAAAEVENPDDEVTQPDDETADDENPPTEDSSEPFIKSGFRKVRAKQFFGSYKDVRFGDDGVCERISDATLAALQSDYPGIELEEID
jgi:hypothetical protein